MQKKTPRPIDYENEKNLTERLINELSEISGRDLNPDTFCLMPWTHISTLPQGEIKLCCRGQPPKSPKDGYDTYNGNPHVQSNDFDLEEYWNSDYMNGVRESLANGEKISQCKNCWKMEDQGIVSLRQNRMIDWQWEYDKDFNYIDNVVQWANTGFTPFRIPLLELKLSNICNFKCRMCWPKDSSLWATDWDRVAKYYDKETQEYVENVHNIAGGKRLYNMFETNPKFIDKLVGLMEHVREIEFAGGEPLLDPIHYRILSNIKHPEQVTLKYSTNLSKLKLNDEQNVIDLWQNFKDVKITISIDGDSELNSKVRRGSDWETLKNNIKEVQNKLGNKISKIKGTTCISAHNALSLDKTAKAIILELGIQWHTSRLQYPEFQHANILPPEQLQESINGLLELKQYFYDNGLPRANKYNVLHIDNAIKWLEYCIKDNKNNSDKYNRFIEFNKELDD